ncbi:glycosyltransferase [Plastorhodobacter daqingensis]|uniref:Glycosyltransferase n=1 Tax=Plastorhodobacter daqingensis TaxID=1387281 RepID=A0ABW2UGP5_9RHOB
MKLLRIIASMDPRQGGPVEGLCRSTERLTALSHETEVICLDPPGVFAGPSAVPVHGMGPVARKYGYTRSVGRWIAMNAGRFDVAVVHGLWNHASVGGGAAVIQAGLPHVVFPHGMMDPWFRRAHPAKHLAKQVLWWAGQGRVLARAHAVLFTSEQERLDAEGVFLGPGYPAQVIPYGAAGPTARPSAGVRLRRRLPALGRYLLFMGRVHSKKGCDLLLQGFARAGAGLELVMAGPEGEAGLIRKLQQQATALGLAGRVHWPGMLTGEDKWDALAGAEAFILPSHQENFGIAVAEALACGTPVLLSDKVNIWREIVADAAGLVAPDTAAGVEQLLERWRALEPDARNGMRHAARQSHARRFHIHRAADALAEVLAEAAEVRA